MGPWTHGGRATFSGDRRLRARRGDRLNGFRLRWFDRWLKDAETGSRASRRCASLSWAAVTGSKSARGGRSSSAGTGVTSQTGPWRARLTPYYLHADGALSPEPPRRRRLRRRRLATRSTPGTRCRRSAATSRPKADVRGAQDQRGRGAFGCRDTLPLSARSDSGLPDRSAGADLEVTGRLIVKLWACFARRHGLHRQAHRRLSAERGLPGRVRPERHRQHRPGPLSRALTKANRLSPASRTSSRSSCTRRRPSSARAPDPARHLEQQLPALRRESQHRRAAGRNRRVVAENTVYHDPAHPSHILLPVIPAAR